MVYISQKEANAIIERYKKEKDEYGIDAHTAEKIVKEIFGVKGFAVPQVRNTMNDPVDPEGWVIPIGEIWGFRVGYKRTGKRGASLSTSWTGDSYRDAFIKMYQHYKERNAKIFPKIERVLYEWRTL